jgi:LPXTG-motif cell wall-anchored protein
MDVHVIEYTPTTDKITLFVRGWSKWAFFQSEAKFYVDGIFLQGAMPAEGMPSTGGTAIWVPIVGLLVVVGLGIWQLRKRKA